MSLGFPNLISCHWSLSLVNETNRSPRYRLTVRGGGPWLCLLCPMLMCRVLAVLERGRLIRGTWGRWQHQSLVSPCILNPPLASLSLAPIMPPISHVGNLVEKVWETVWFKPFSDVLWSITCLGPCKECSSCGLDVREVRRGESCSLLRVHGRAWDNSALADTELRKPLGKGLGLSADNLTLAVYCYFVTTLGRSEYYKVPL